ncbi:HlyD family efflux transporter periplasmic adaptor subunit [Bowmanella denitrificans]|uniref:HlyD family efflux transporter periplasmic adaptor subunit n=1 Tax=Bowmanella denitrificans TaxID=366582 RepID=A0ABN0X9A3_9ALTE
MQGSLFRTQAVAHQQDRLHGQVLVIPCFSHSIIAISLLIWVAVVVVWLASSQYARKETVNGWLEPAQGLVRLYPDSGQGRIKQILVAEGEEVLQGQPLMVINGDKVLADGEHLEALLLAEYQSQQQILTRKLARFNQVHQLKLQDIEQQLLASKADLVQLQGQATTLAQHYKLLSARASDYQHMHSLGHISAREVQDTEEQRLTLQSQLQGLEREKVNQLNRIEQLQTQQALLPAEQQNQLDDTQRSLSDLAQRIAQLNGQRAYVIKASIDGTVTNLQARIGQQVQVDKPLVTLVPADSLIEANLLVPVRAAGFLQAGQALDIRYDAFPYQKFGLYQGQVTEVSDSVLLPNEISQSLVAVAEPVYLVKAMLHSQSVQAYGQQLSLKAGMSLSADIRLKERSLLEWLFEPLLSLKGRV